MTIGDRLNEVRAPSGFDYLRLGLAFAVLLIHSFDVSYGSLYLRPLMFTPFRPAITIILAMFFALSGFLVCGSLIRSPSLIAFGAHRFLRLVPALTVEVLLSAILLGAVFTTLPLSEYYSSSGFAAYFLNIVGHVQFLLPGVFLDNPHPEMVNLSLWTLPYELDCYLLTFVVGILGLLRRRILLTAIAALVSIGFALRHNIDPNVARAEYLALPGRALVVCFAAGACLYLWRDHIRLNRWMLVCSAVLTWAALASPRTQHLAAFPVAYLTAYVGLLNPAKVFVVKDGDYSYGVYLFAYPIQQAYVALFPPGRIWWATFLVCGTLSLLYASFSWHFVEAPVLSRRKAIVGWLNNAAMRARGQFRRRLPARGAS